MSWDPTQPRKDPFPEVVTLMAQSGYGVHRARKQQARTWADLHDHERFRWQLAADAMANHHLHSPEQVRAIYFIGYIDMPWEDSKPAVRKRWEAIAQAMRNAFDTWTARQRQAAERAAAKQRQAADDLARAQRAATPPSKPLPVLRPKDPQPAQPTIPANARQVASLRERLIQKQRERRKDATA